MKSKITLLSAIVALTLTGCGSKEPEKEVVVENNEAPVIKMESSFSVDEGDSIEIPLQILDDGTSLITPTLSGIELGSLSYKNDSGTLSLIYEAPDNVSEEQVLEAQVTANDGVNNPVVFDFEITVNNIRNEAPELEDISTVEAVDNSTFTVPFVVSDVDNDKLSYELTSSSSNENVQATLNESSSSIDFNVDTLDVASFSSDYTLIVRDAEEEDSVTFTVNVTKVLTAPKILLTPSEFDFEEGNNYIVSFGVSDNHSSYENLNIDVEQSPSNSYNVTLNTENKEIIFSDLNITKDVTENIDFTVTNEFGLISTETIVLNLKNTQKVSINAIAEDLEVLNEKYEFIQNNGFDELVFFDFYLKVAGYKNPDKISEVTSFRDLIEDDLEGDLVEIKTAIDYIDDFVKNSEDESKSPHYEEKINELTQLLNEYGKNGVFILNTVSEKLDSGLPEFSESDVVQVSEEYTNEPSFSRYVGNESYGSFINDKFVFSTQYKFMEDINFLRQQCL